MSFKCSRCRQSYVANQGDVCMSCLLKGDTNPSASGGGYGDAGNNYNAGNDYNTGNNYNVPMVPSEPPSSVAEGNGKSFGTVTVKGTIQNFRQEREPRSVVQRLFSSIFKGTAFSLSDERCVFDVVEDNVRTLNFDSRTGASVVVNGKVAFGTISNNHIVEVTGYRSKRYGVISAQKIYDISNGTKITASGQISANAVRLVCLVVVALIAMLVVGLVDIISGASSLAGTSFFEKAVTVLLGVALIIITLKFGRRMRSKTKLILLGLGVLILLSVFSPGAIGPLVSAVITIVACFMLLKSILR